jgi:hypothetical protein
MSEMDGDRLAVAYMEAVAAALDETSLRLGHRGDMGAALAALSACQAQLLATIKDGKTRKFMREDCNKKLQQYLTASMASDTRGVHKESLAVLPPKVH